MIVNDLMGTLRVDMESDISPDNPFSCLGTRENLNTSEMHRAFAEARDLTVVPPKRKSSAASFLGTTPSKGRDGASEREMVLKVTKVGLLSRRGALAVLPCWELPRLTLR